jgi:hypothetical protein
MPAATPTRVRHRERPRALMVLAAVLGSALTLWTAPLSAQVGTGRSTRDTTKQTDQRIRRTGAKGSTTGATLPNGALPPIIAATLCRLTGAPTTMTAANANCRSCATLYTEGSATLWQGAPTCTPCTRPGLGTVWSGGISCGPKTLIANLGAITTFLAVIADPSGSVAPLGAYPITTWQYTFGDGSPAVTMSLGTPVPHTYATAGTYTITLTVSNTNGDAPGTTTRTITVGPPPCVAGPVNTQILPCGAGFSGTITQTQSPNTAALGPAACPYLGWVPTLNNCVADVQITAQLNGAGSGSLNIAPAGLVVAHPGAGTSSGTVTVASGSAHLVTITAAGGALNHRKASPAPMIAAQNIAISPAPGTWGMPRYSE